MDRPGIEHSLRQYLQLAALRGGRLRPWEGIIDETDGITKVALEPPADVAEPFGW
jgi:hypothetical protein